ncbi:MAG TPA: protein-L-isoaspartate O-methyltransferase [Steroidobacteraceae bacterium]|jgi:protein-L-isoaspartate(D-aspartate) O-methyltransferase
MARKHLVKHVLSISNRQISAAGIDHNGKGDSAAFARGPERPRTFTITLSAVIKDRTLCRRIYLPFPATFQPRHGPKIAMNIELARQQMIEQQIHTWDVFDERVLNVMREVKREIFAPVGWTETAFADAAIPLGHGQSMLPPKVHGRILQALELKPEDQVLEVGTGSGYLAACLGKLSSRVRSLEVYPDLAATAGARLFEAAINNVAVETADAMQLQEESRYDAIAVTGSLPLYDERFQRALRPGGRLFVVVGAGPAMEAWKITRIGEREWQREGLFETVIEPLVNAPKPSAFVF